MLRATLLFAARLGRSPSTISRELQRNALPKAGYKSASADRMAMARKRRGSKIERMRPLKTYVLDSLAMERTRWIVTEISFAHIGLLASILGKKVSTNLATIQTMLDAEIKIWHKNSAASQRLATIPGIGTRYLYRGLAGTTKTYEEGCFRR